MNILNQVTPLEVGLSRVRLLCYQRRSQSWHFASGRKVAAVLCAYHDQLSCISCCRVHAWSISHVAERDGRKKETATEFDRRALRRASSESKSRRWLSRHRENITGRSK